MGVNVAVTIFTIVSTVKAAGISPVAGTHIDEAIAIDIADDGFRVAVFVMHDEVANLSCSEISRAVSVIAVVAARRQRVASVAVGIRVNHADGTLIADRPVSRPHRRPIGVGPDRPPNAYLVTAGSDVADNVAFYNRVGPTPSVTALEVHVAGANEE
jgi:hypothetical protein